MDRHIYVECGRNMTNKIRKEVNGLVKFEVYPEADLIVFKIIFKDFDFKYAFKDIQDLMYTEGFDEAIDIMLRKYKKAVLSGFFKSNERKRLDEKKDLGLEGLL